MALLSLVFLLLAIMLGFIRKMNTGLLCIAFALLLGRMAGISDAEIIKGFFVPDAFGCNLFVQSGTD